MIIYLQICEVNHEHYKSCANFFFFFFFKLSRGMSSFSVIFLSSTLLRKKIILWFFKFFSYMNHQTLFSHFLQDKKTCNNWNLRLLLLHMSLLHLTIWKCVNFLGGKLIYNIKRRYGFHYFNVGSCSKNFSVGHMLIRFVYSLDPLKYKLIVLWVHVLFSFYYISLLNCHIFLNCFNNLFFNYISFWVFWKF